MPRRSSSAQRKPSADVVRWEVIRFDVREFGRGLLNLFRNDPIAIVVVAANQKIVFVEGSTE